MRNRRFIAITFAVLCTIATMGPAFAEETTMTPLDIPMIGDMEALQPGEEALDWELKDADGNPFTFTAAGPGAKMLVFWSIFCEPCREEMPLIQSLYAKNKDKGLQVVAIALDGDLRKNIKQFAKQGGYSFTVVLDEESEDGSLIVAEDYVVPGTPTIYLIDKSGKITYSKVGRVGETELEKEIAKALGQ